MPQALQGLIMPIALIAIMYFLMIRPQRKREKEIQEMRDSLKVGDEILTIGGIYGKITRIKDEVLTVEVGSDKTRFNITKWAVGSVINSKSNEKTKNE